MLVAFSCCSASIGGGRVACHLRDQHLLSSFLQLLRVSENQGLGEQPKDPLTQKFVNGVPKFRSHGSEATQETAGIIDVSA